MNKQPRVTCIIPCYNAENWVEEAVSSVLSQSYENLEIFAIDNESTDGTLVKLKAIKENLYPDLIVESVPNIYPLCCQECVEAVLPKMSGDYFFIMGADDLLYTNFVRNNINFILNRQFEISEEILIWQSQIISINAESAILQERVAHSYKDLEEFKALCLKHSPVATPTVFYSKKLVDMGLYKPNSEEFSGAADYDLYCQLADAGVFIHIIPMAIGYYYRWHPEQSTWGMHRQPVNYDAKIKEKWRNKWQVK